MAFIAIDWGSTNCRAWLLEGGQALDSRATGEGIRNVPGGRFEEAFDRLVAGWEDRAETVLLSGMIASRGGWVETGYVPCPADVSRLAEGCVERRRGGLRLFFLPGVSQGPGPGAPADVMRGEELQLLGLGASGACTAILPGTHSKWARMDGTRILGFRTMMTGELYHLLLTQSLAGRLAEGDAFDEAAFAVATRRAYGSETWLGDLFEARSGVLLGALPATAVAAHLSGMLIGRELREGAAAFEAEGAWLVGEGALCDRYLAAAGAAGLRLRKSAPDLAVEGFRRLAPLLGAPEAGPS